MRPCVDTSVSAKAARLARKVDKELGGGGSSSSHEKVERLARGLRSDPESFEDDGCQRAREASLYPPVREMLDDDQRSKLDEAAMGGPDLLIADTFGQAQDGQRLVVRRQEERGGRVRAVVSGVCVRWGLVRCRAVPYAP